MVASPLHLSLRARAFTDGLPSSTAWLLSDCMEYVGKQQLWIGRKPEVLAALRERAIVQSVESSNRIEGVTIPAARLRPLVLARARPRDRSEEELAGYRNALNWIFTRPTPPPINSRTILHLHALAHGGASGDAGRFKVKNNEIIELRPGVGRVVRFVPTSARLTPRAIHQLCDTYDQAIQRRMAPPLLLASTFILDFFCIHPFRDGNGRASRLLTTLLLEHHGILVSRYVSLERIVEETRDDYYRVLRESSLHWHEGTNAIAPWWNYFLTIVRRAYGEFAAEVEHRSKSGGKSQLARTAVLSQTGEFTLADVRAQVPSASSQLLKKVLATLKAEGKIKLTGHGRGARWSIVD